MRLLTQFSDSIQPDRGSGLSVSIQRQAYLQVNWIIGSVDWLLSDMLLYLAVERGSRGKLLLGYQVLSPDQADWQKGRLR